jgi:hypothetical protein
MELSELLDTSPETLAIAQKKALSAHVCARLSQIMDAIHQGRYDEVRKLTFESPAGDGMGSDNTCIDFAPAQITKHGAYPDVWDIGVVLAKLQQLDEVIKASQGEKTPAKGHKR